MGEGGLWGMLYRSCSGFAQTLSTAAAAVITDGYVLSGVRRTKTYHGKTPRTVQSLVIRTLGTCEFES